ncbi:Aspartate-semialdehyde dehydrogenase [Fusobacterium necrogenes]|uniref:Aspartate-semialdehyde dehydrogenase n=1 Tax=Fusobacterium necrogenes TaxID=858 RepID=A0A377GWQ8_9FUSO|nr:aspartate-semialdehyde dehydrogenase [Fusobacterium necrogenes]STO31044.1 Aspartate-semialdehyde dehydrogenase [Fusobacterium necrogenes]
MRVAVVGATGLVGSTFLKVLNERDLGITELFLFASSRSAGKKIDFKGKECLVEELREDSFKGRDIDIALFSAGGEISLKYAPLAAQEGILVIDNSSAWRMNKEVPLIVPEVNPQEAFKHKGIIANPNCSTIQCMAPLKILANKYGIKRVVYSTYQAVSGTGHKGIVDLEEGLKGNPPKTYPHQIVNNCLPHIDVFLDNGYTKEEKKMIDETRKILDLPELPVTATCVRVPVINSHSVSINVELEKDFDIDELKKELASLDGIILLDEVEKNVYPLPVNATGKDEVFVGRIRRDESVKYGVNLWTVADNIRKGAATNAIQIAELFKDRF